MSTTKTWAESVKVDSAANLSPVPGYSKIYAHTAREIATRAIILQGVVAVAYEVAAQPIIGSFQEQGIWGDVTPNERGLLLSAKWTGAKQVEVRWKQEAEWTLLWMIGKVESLGLPTHCCDTRRLADEIIPALGSPLQDF